jgi:drug/metabolite transporter superfamily protein YnfA
MKSMFNIAFRIVSSLLGLLCVALGGVWMLQGLSLAFKVGFMVGDPKWTLFGAILALVGVGQVIWSNSRQA